MADKVFGADFTDTTTPTGSETISINNGTILEDTRLDNMIGSVSHVATNKTPVDADEFPLSNSAASWALGHATWVGIKSTLKTYFDTLYDWATNTHAATGKTTPIDGDELAIVDTAASNVIKKLTWANLKGTLTNSLGAMIATMSGKTTPVDADIFAIADSAATNASKGLTWANVKATILSSFGAMIATLSSKATPADADILVIADSAATNASKGLTWTNVKATLKTYLDTLYAPITRSQSFCCTNGSGALAAGSTNYFGIAYSNTTESLAYLVWPVSGTVKNMYIYSQGSPGVGQTYTATFRNNLADTAITCQITSGNNSASDTTHTASVTAGQRWSVKIVLSASAATTNFTIAFEFVPS